MKVIKFRDNLVPLVLSGEKTSTWRLFDDKNISVGDKIELREFGKDTSFASAKVIKVIEKPFKGLTAADKAGHEPFVNPEEMYTTFSGYYDRPVGPNTLVKIIWFANLKKL